MYRCDSANSRCTSIVLPDCRGPVTATAGNSAAALFRSGSTIGRHMMRPQRSRHHAIRMHDIDPKVLLLALRHGCAPLARNFGCQGSRPCRSFHVGFKESTRMDSWRRLDRACSGYRPTAKPGTQAMPPGRQPRACGTGRGQESPHPHAREWLQRIRVPARHAGAGDGR